VNVGALKIEIISGGAFKLDGGGMFGVVPRALWSRLYAPDEAGRIQLETNCLLVRAGSELMLVDTGNGSKLNAKEREIFDVAPGNPLLEHLAARGVDPADITTVLLTHLHMDHVGGASHLDGDQAVASFPNARFVVQRQEWEDAVTNRSHMRTSYKPENLAPLEATGRLVLLDGDAEVAPGVSVRVTGGHTRAHQCVRFQSQGEGAVFLADVCPTPAHLRQAYNMAYDMEPYATMQAKAALLEEAEREGWTVLFDHEPMRKAIRLAREDGRIVPALEG
jgi:glyoxylase-like metal-dependent hydrolase (beta-lactamase superfamily II)